ncbi:hypothetical protein, partial [Caballeronia arationis]|uniref:hypothetical protein n=1 Tax=Caballeronia arationis TaxID=1777142 RepID=UPI000A40CE67
MDYDFALLQRTRAWLTDGVLNPSYQAYLTYLIGRGCQRKIEMSYRRLSTDVVFLVGCESCLQR